MTANISKPCSRRKSVAASTTGVLAGNAAPADANIGSILRHHHGEQHDHRTDGGQEQDHRVDHGRGQLGAELLGALAHGGELAQRLAETHPTARRPAPG